MTWPPTIAVEAIAGKLGITSAGHHPVLISRGIPTNGNVSRELLVRKLTCSGYFFFMMFMGMAKTTSCAVDGDVFDPPQPRARGPAHHNP